jgi:regulatory protein
MAGGRPAPWVVTGDDAGDDAGPAPLDTPEQKALRARALRWLAQREHSRAELEQKLGRWVRQQVARLEDGGAGAARAGSAAMEWSASAAGIAAVLDRLEACGLLSDARVAASLSAGRGQGWGRLRLQQALRRKGVGESLVRDTLAQTASSELERAQALWVRRFGQPAADRQEQARQARFLAARGFDAEVIRRVLRGLPDED